MKTKFTLSSLLIFCCLCSAALAQGYSFAPPWANSGWGCYYNSSPYFQESVPYYALHPPVYYSYPRPRTYGDSPFPYLPGMANWQNDQPVPQPQVVKNNYFEDSDASTDQQYQTNLPKRIRNPFVEQTDNTNVSNGVKWDAKKQSKPSVVYPTALARRTK